MIRLSILVPVFNEEKHILPLLQQIQQTMQSAGISYQVIFVDDHSADKTVETIRGLAYAFPLEIYTKSGKKGKAFSLLEASHFAQGEYIGIIDAGSHYFPSDFPRMIAALDQGADVVVGRRINPHSSAVQEFFKQSYRNLNSFLFKEMPEDVQSGIKIFRREVMERVREHMDPSPWSFDLEFLLLAKEAGYSIKEVDVQYQRINASGKLLAVSLDMGGTALRRKMSASKPIPFNQAQTEKEGHGFHYKGQKFIHHTTIDTRETAFKRVSRTQLVHLILFAMVMVGLLLVNWHLTVLITIALLTALYFTDLIFNLFLIYRSFSKSPEVVISRAEIRSHEAREWPSYTIFCPLYKEAHVVPQFVAAMEKFDYPKNKLQIMLLLEADDIETIEYAKQANLPPEFEVVIVPPSNPKTKPKACNYGLTKATGEYCVIYDAEDVPDPLQLKKAIIAFEKLKGKIFCVQAKLNFYNPHQNILTRVFTAEYSLWFDLVLTGLQSIKAPIPLGGTSNHFRTKDLKGVAGWDAFNVTEDCDLGIRLVKRGYLTTIVESTTLEEANSSAINWFWQRTRWIKGYMQTYLVHSRNPKSFFQSENKLSFITFQLVVGGKILSMFVNPLMWTITIGYFVFRATVAPFIESFFPAPIFYMAIFSLVIGNFLYVYYYMIGSMKRGQDELVKFAFLVPLYWLAMSMAAWVAVYKLIRQPHFWFKTQHGLHLNKDKVLLQIQKNIAKNVGEFQVAAKS